jgi:hypothetical protein
MAATDIKNIGNNLLGPSYDYNKQIRTPRELGMSDKGSIQVLAKDITGLMAYVDLLVKGTGKASKTGKPLGNKFFLNTSGTCTDKATGKSVQRNIYINNVPDGSIPFITSGMNVNFNEFKGLAPGVMSNVARINPMQIMQSFTLGNSPECQAVTLETINVKNVSSQQTKYLTTVDIQTMPPCWFPNRMNPITGEQCRETFVGSMLKGTPLSNENISADMPDDIISKMYFSVLSVFGIYIFIKYFQISKQG